MDKNLQEKVRRARELLISVQHAAMATVNEDGSPHNTPYFFMCNADLTHLYWGSHPQSEHSKNVARTGQIFVVLYDAFQRGGLFVRARSARIADAEELGEAVAECNHRRALRGLETLPRSCYKDGNSQRMYIADTQQFWVNGAERDADGRIVRDIRIKISKEALLEGA